MFSTTRRVLLLFVVVALCLPGLSFAKKKDHVATAPMDDGRLVPSWFGEGLTFREAEDAFDYLWVKEGFSIDGHTFHFIDWPEPQLLGEKAADRDENDRRLARQMASDMARSFSDVWGRAWKGKAETSQDKGDVRVEGRLVDSTTGSTGAKIFVGFGAGAGGTTIDLKFVDAESGELLAAMHHRVVSGTTWSTTDSKFFKWLEEVGEEIAKKGLYSLFEKGDPQDE